MTICAACGGTWMLVRTPRGILCEDCRVLQVTAEAEPQLFAGYTFTPDPAAARMAARWNLTHGIADVARGA